MRITKREWTQATLISVGILFIGLTGLVVTSALNTSQNASEAVTEVVVPTEEITPDGLFLELNELRIQNGLEPLEQNSKLNKSAKLKCQDMVKYNYYDHKNPKTGKKGYTYVQDVGQKAEYTSENLNAGMFKSVQEVIDSWSSSKSHKAAMLNPKYTDVGFAVCEIKKYPGEQVIVSHYIEPSKALSDGSTSSNVRGSNTQSSGSSATPSTCDQNAKDQLTYYYKKQVSRIEEIYRLYEDDPEYTDSGYPELKRDGQLNVAQAKYNENLYAIGCY